ncbi:MAG TPA: YggS family pyridoxal phosphate-dependent enzyme [Armatimonadota bacterium]|nr:YggS family pyridoxal phosphate-dependent enzyme [Armatimonadota bacterium]
MQDISARLQVVNDRIARAAERAQRDPGDVKLVAVSKTKTLEESQAAISAGAAALGENYAQELLRKHQALGESVEWHFIGHLQSNKAKYLVPFCELIHGVDSEKLAGEISKRAANLGRKQPVLIEVNLADEATKHGVSEDGAADLARRIADLPSVDLRGLMMMAPYSDDPEDSRPYFERLRRLRDVLVDGGLAEENCRELSMGMTGDFEVAVEEGATIVRVGTAIFGSRQTT